jgi:lysophospholipase L1-like esterase
MLVDAALGLWFVAIVSALASPLSARNDVRWMSVVGSASALHEPIPVIMAPVMSPPSYFNRTEVLLQNATIRGTFRVSHASDQLRLRLTNVFGSTTLNITSMTIALPSPNRPGARAIDPSTLLQVTFGGDNSVILPIGSDYLSDPIHLSVVGACEVSVSTYLKGGQRSTIGLHSVASNTAFYVSGDATRMLSMSGANEANDTSSYFVFAIEGLVPAATKLIVTIGDSITDGFGSTIDGSGRYPDFLSERLNARGTSGYSVINMGLSGNRVLSDGGWAGLALLARVERDIFSHAGVTHVVLLEGINDLNLARFGGLDPVSAGDLTRAYEQFITRLHQRGIVVIGATIMQTQAPSLDSIYYDASTEMVREETNEWIRNSGKFDHVVDFDMAVRNSSYPKQMQVQYAIADSLHPNSLGYKAMADAFDLAIIYQTSGRIDY